MTSLAGNDWRRTDKGLASCAEKEIKIIEFIAGASYRVNEDLIKFVQKSSKVLQQ